MPRITMYLITGCLFLLYTHTAQGASTDQHLTHITPVILHESIVYPSGFITLPLPPTQNVSWTSVRVPETLVHDTVRIQLWDINNAPIGQFGTRTLDSPIVDLSMIDATLYPSMRIVLFDTQHHFSLDTLYPVTFTSKAQFNTRLLVFVLFYIAVLLATLAMYIRTPRSLFYTLRHTGILSRRAPPAHILLISLGSLTLFAIALGSYTSSTHIVYLAIKLPILLYGASTLSAVAIYVLLTLLDVSLSLRQFLRATLQSLLAVSLLLAAITPLVIFYIFYPFDHDALLVMVIILFGLSGYGGAQHIASTVLHSIKKSRWPALLATTLWLCIYGAVLMQLGWMLRPWVGVEDAVFHTVPFARPYSGNVFIEIIHTLQRL